MSKFVNIYPSVVFHLPKRTKAYIDQLKATKQIDCDANGHPFLLKTTHNGPNVIASIVRNGKQENFVINPRSKRDPEISWDADDGYQYERPVDAPVDAPVARGLRVYEDMMEALDDQV